MKDADYILIEEYLNGNLSPEERHAFEHRLENDPELAEAFSSYRQVSGFLEREFAKDEEGDAFKANLAAISRKYFSKDHEVKNKGRQQLWKLLAAACLVLAMGLYFFQKLGLPAYEDYADIQPISLAVRGDMDALSLKAENAFNSGQYAEAAAYFAEMLKSDSTNMELRLYYAIALTESDNYEKSERVFDELSRIPSPVQYEALWYYALSKLKQEDYEACEDLLSSIPKEANEYSKAQKLLKKLP